jgi:hypothetical protein
MFAVSHCRTGITVMQDIKELMGALMRALANDEITEDEIIDLGFEADGQLLPALNAAYILNFWNLCMIEISDVLIVI